MIPVKPLLAWFIVNVILGIIAGVGLIISTTPVVNEIAANVWLGGVIFSVINMLVVFAVGLASDRI